MKVEKANDETEETFVIFAAFDILVGSELQSPAIFRQRNVDNEAVKIMKIMSHIESLLKVLINQTIKMAHE